MYPSPPCYFHYTQDLLKHKTKRKKKSKTKPETVSAEPHVVQVGVKIYGAVLLLCACLSYADL